MASLYIKLAIFLRRCEPTWKIKNITVLFIYGILLLRYRNETKSKFKDHYDPWKFHHNLLKCFGSSEPILYKQKNKNSKNKYYACFTKCYYVVLILKWQTVTLMLFITSIPPRFRLCKLSKNPYVIITAIFLVKNKNQFINLCKYLLWYI